MIDDFDALLAAGVCDCGVRFEDIVMIEPKPWGYGRPCSAELPKALRRREPDDRALPSSGSRGVTDRQREVVRIVRKNGGNRHAAALELGVSAAAVFRVLRYAERAGLPVPAAR
jgi:hypothetical protein